MANNGRSTERILLDLPPLKNIGTDYSGPINMMRSPDNLKHYGVLFSCMASRAVYLGVANSLDTDLCINALTRFIISK